MVKFLIVCFALVALFVATAIDSITPSAPHAAQLVQLELRHGNMPMLVGEATSNSRQHGQWLLTQQTRNRADFAALRDESNRLQLERVGRASGSQTWRIRVHAYDAPADAEPLAQLEFVVVQTAGGGYRLNLADEAQRRKHPNRI